MCQRYVIDISFVNTINFIHIYNYVRFGVLILFRSLLL